MTTAEFLLASMLPALLWGLRAVTLRQISARAKLAIDLVLILFSVPIGMELIGRILNFPPDAADHSPGLGVAFMLLFLVWLVCMILWFIFAVAVSRRNRRPPP